MSYNIINLITSFVCYVLAYFFKTGSIIPIGNYTTLFYYFISIIFIFSVYYSPVTYSIRERSLSALYQFLFTLFSLSILVSLTNIIDISRLFLFSIVAFSVSVGWLVGFFYQKLSIYEDKDRIDFIVKNTSITENSIERENITILSTANPANFYFSSNKVQNLIINLTQVNNFKLINDMFLTIRNKMNPGGLYVGSFSPLEENYQKMQALMSDVIILMKRPKVFGEAFSSLLFIENITIIFLWVFIIQLHYPFLKVYQYL